MRKLTAKELFEKQFKKAAKSWEDYYKAPWWSNSALRESFVSHMYWVGRQAGILSVRKFNKKKREAI